MTIIELGAAPPMWVFTIALPIAIVVFLGFLVGACIIKTPEMGVFGFLVAFLIWGMILGGSSGSMTDANKERVVQEVAKVSCVDPGDIDINDLRNERPVKGIFYVKADGKLVVENHDCH